MFFQADIYLYLEKQRFSSIIHTICSGLKHHILYMLHQLLTPIQETIPQFL